MKKYLSMISFVVLMGAVAIGILIGADALTKDRIAQNAELTWKSAILTHHEIAHNDTNFATVFNESFEIQEGTVDGTDQVLTVYVNKSTDAKSFRFSGNGLWDIIEGVITLQADFNTIVAITVTKQAETPGLGGIVAEKQYLDKYVGKHFDETLGLVIVKNPPTTDYEVDAIVGATGTSNAFAGLLNLNYKQFNALFGNTDPLAPFKKALLNHNGVSFTNDNYVEVFDEEFTITTAGDLTLYTSKSGRVSYAFTTEGAFGSIYSVITLEEDFQTITKITVLTQTEGWGASIQTKPEVLAAFEGKKFNTDIVVVPEPSQDNEVLDGFGGATTTKKKFTEGLNKAYHLHYAAFVDGETTPPIDETAPLKQALLSHNGISFTEENYQELFDLNFSVVEKESLTLYKHMSGTLSYEFTTEGFRGPINAVITLASDFDTIVKITVLSQTEGWGASIETKPEVLAAFIGKKLSSNLVVVDNPTQDNEVLDGFGGATTTKSKFVTGLNSNYETFYNAFAEEHIDTMKKALLTHHNVEFTSENFDTLFSTSFISQTVNNLTIYTHTNGSVSYKFMTEGFRGPIEVAITLASDFDTIIKVTVLSQSERWGSVIQTDPVVLAAYEGKKLSTNLVVVDNPTQDNEVLDGFGNATTTKNKFTSGLFSTYELFAETFKGGN